MRSFIPAREFSYAMPEDSAYRRAVIHWIEQATGKPRLRRLYEDYANGPAVEDFFAEAVARLALNVRVHGGVTGIPKTGPLVIVANHPFGVIAGIVLGYLISLVRSDFKILVHSVLCRLPELRPHLLPIDFSETRAALKTNLTTRAEARRLVADGGAIVAFPGGTVSTAPTWLGRAVDPAWKPFTAELIIRSQATVVPMFFEGQNSRLFQIASQFSQTLRLSLVFKEVVRRIGSEVGIRIGAPLAFSELAPLGNKAAMIEQLRARTYRLGGITQATPVVLRSER